MKKVYTWLVYTLLITVAIFTGIIAIPTNTGASKHPDHIALSITGNAVNSMTITWRTDTTITAGIVQYQSTSGFNKALQQTKADSAIFSTDLGTERIFSATLYSLTADTKYMYRVGDGTHWSELHAFSTAGIRSNTVTFLVFGDSQSAASTKGYALWRDTVHKAYQRVPTAKFMVNVGDLVDTGQSGAQWNAWYETAVGVIDSIPEMPVVGNHETYGKVGNGRPSYFVSQFRLPQNGPTSLKGQVYSFDYGPVHCVVLDSQHGEEHASGDILAPQRKWLAADLAATRAPWKIVFFHKPPYGLKSDMPNPAIKAAFCPIMEQYHVDIVFNGHDHGIAHTFPIRGGVYMKKPSQGTIYYVTGRSGVKTYPNLRKLPWMAFFYNPLDQPNYQTVEVRNNKLTVKSIKEDGTLVDSFTIDKDRDTLAVWQRKEPFAYSLSTEKRLAAYSGNL